MIKFGIVVHGGVGSQNDHSDGCKVACEAGVKILKKGGSAFNAVKAAVTILEDDGRFNAGRGSVLRLDGKTIEMDSSIMDSQKRIGCIGAIYNVKNPVLIAAEVINTPHVFLAGKGAVEYAQKKGFSGKFEPSNESKNRHKKLCQMLKKSNYKQMTESWKNFNIKANWNFDLSYEEIFGGDTVGAVAKDSNGLFAVASSTGGASPMLRGRIGDAPIIGCGFFTGPNGAVAATGIGEEIIKNTLSRNIYEAINNKLHLQKHCEKSIKLFDKNIPIGLIAISAKSFAIAHNHKQMASAVIIQD